MFDFKDGKELFNERKQAAEKLYEEFVGIMNNAWKKYDIEQALRKKGKWQFKKDYVLDTKLFSLDSLPSEYDVFEPPYSIRHDILCEVFDIPRPFSDRIYLYLDAFAYEYKFSFEVKFVPKKWVTVFHFLFRRKIKGTYFVSVELGASSYDSKKYLFENIGEA